MRNALDSWPEDPQKGHGLPPPGPRLRPFLSTRPALPARLTCSSGSSSNARPGPAGRNGGMGRVAEPPSAGSSSGVGLGGGLGVAVLGLPAAAARDSGQLPPCQFAPAAWACSSLRRRRLRPHQRSRVPSRRRGRRLRMSWGRALRARFHVERPSPRFVCSSSSESAMLAAGACRAGISRDPVAPPCGPSSH